MGGGHLIYTTLLYAYIALPFWMLQVEKGQKKCTLPDVQFKQKGRALEVRHGFRTFILSAKGPLFNYKIVFFCPLIF